MQVNAVKINKFKKIGDVYFGENIATSYFEVRQAVNGKSLFVGQVEVKNMLDLTDPKILKQMGIDQKKLMMLMKLKRLLYICLC